jgi:DNA-binding NarL/FixJ family response regulator
MGKRIFIIDDDESSRFLYRLNFRNVPEIEIVGEFENGEDALVQIPLLKPDVVIVDYELPGMSGVEFAGHLDKYPQIRILLVTGHDMHYLSPKLPRSSNLEVVPKSWSDEDVNRIIQLCQ